MIKLGARYRDWGIFNKLLTMFLIIALISSVGIGATSFYSSSEMVRESTTKQAMETLQQISQNISHQLENIEVIADSISFNSQIQNILNREVVPGNEGALTRQIAESIMILYYSSDRIGDIEIYGNNGALFNVAEGRTIRSEREIADYIRRAKASAGGNVWLNEVVRYGSLQLLKEIRDPNTMNSLGVIRISVRAEYLYSLLQDVDFSAQGYIVLLDRNGEPVIGNGVDPQRLAGLDGDAGSGSFELTLEDKKSMVLYYPIFNQYLKIYGVIPLDKLYENVERLKRNIFVIAAITLAIALLLAHRMSRMIVKPIKSMMEPMKAAANGQFHFRLPVNSRDEIGQLRKGYNAMTSKISALIVDVYKEELLKKESDFRALQAQINPHFLYNTLETINWMAKLSNMDEISRMVTSVSRLMRISINNKKRIISVEEELGYIQDYLYIQKTRYSDRLQTLIDVDQELLELSIPTLLLQPLLENAIIHGLEKKKTKGFVRLLGYCEDGLAVFEVYDDGVGMPEETLATLLSGASDSEDQDHTGLGIITVHRRIQFIFGPEYGLEVRSEVDRGTTVRLRLPVSMCNEAFLERIAHVKNNKR